MTLLHWNICIGKLNVLQPIIFVHRDRVAHWVLTLRLDGGAHEETLGWMFDQVFFEDTALFALNRKLVHPLFEGFLRVLSRFPLVMH